MKPVTYLCAIYVITGAKRQAVEAAFDTLPKAKQRLVQQSRVTKGLFRDFRKGPAKWTPRMMPILPDELDDKLAELQADGGRLLALHWPDGRQYGQTFDIDGNITGTPVYPIDNDILQVVPDRFDENGKSLPRPATLQDALDTMPVFFGMRKRRA